MFVSSRNVFIGFENEYVMLRELYFLPACFLSLQLIIHHRSLPCRHGKPLSLDEVMGQEKAAHHDCEIDFRN